MKRGPLLLAWHMVGLVSAETGALMIAGWGGLFLVTGVWMMLSTAYDAALAEKREKQ